MKEEETFLDLALKAVVEALRMNSDRYKIIYDSKYDSDDNLSNSSITLRLYHLPVLPILLLLKPIKITITMSTLPCIVPKGAAL